MGHNLLVAIKLASVFLLISVCPITFVHALNSTIFVGVHVKDADSYNLTASVYNGRTFAEKTEIVDSNRQNGSYLFEFDVKNVPESTNDERQYEDEDEDAEFRICALLDKGQDNNKRVSCKNTIINDTKENITIEFN